MSRLFLVWHGQSVWNLQNRFTGWVDISLSEHGVMEAQQAARLLIDEHFDVAFTSMLMRAQDSLYEILRHNLEALHMSASEPRRDIEALKRKYHV